MQSLWQYIASHKELQLTSFDIGLNTNHVKQAFEKELLAITDQLAFSKTDRYPIFKTTLAALIQARPVQDFTVEEKTLFFQSIDEILSQAKQQYPKDELLQRQLHALIAKSEYYWLRNYREKHMADNLNWLIKHKYPKDKIIVWTASFHAVKNIYAVVENVGERAKHYYNAVKKDSVETMIQILKRDTAISTYVFNMISTSGMYTPTAWTSIHNTADSISIPSGNIEKFIADLPAPYYFLDLKSLPETHWLQAPIPMIGMLHRNTYNARWPKVFDGLFFIRNMKPLSPL